MDNVWSHEKKVNHMKPLVLRSSDLHRIEDEPASDEPARGMQYILGNDWHPELGGVMLKPDTSADSGHRVLKRSFLWAMIAATSAASLEGRHSDNSKLAFQSP